MHLKNRLDVGEFAVLVEMEPPKGVDVSTMVSAATKVKKKVDAFVVPDMSGAVMRMSSLGGAVVLQGKGMEAVVQICCRDRNRLALQADILAAYACGITNIMAIVGEDLTYGDHHQAKTVDDMDVITLLRAIGSLEAGRDMGGAELNGAPSFFRGATLNIGVTGDAMNAEIEEMNRRMDAGAQFFVAAPVFDLEAVAPFLEKIDIRGANVIPTVLPLKSVGMARYIARNMKHMHLPPSLITRLQKAPDKTKESLSIARETIEALKERGFKGVMISTLGWEQKLPNLLE